MAHYDTHTKPKDCLSGHIILLRLTAERYCTLLPLLSASIVLFGDLFFIVLLTIWHYWIGTSIGLFCRLLGHYVKPVWSSYPHCSFGHDCSAHRLDWVPLSCSLYGAWWALAYGPYGPPGLPHLVDSCQKQNPGYTFSSHFLWVESTHFTHLPKNVLGQNQQPVQSKFWVFLLLFSAHILYKHLFVHIQQRKNHFNQNPGC